MPPPSVDTGLMRTKEKKRGRVQPVPATTNATATKANPKTKAKAKTKTKAKATKAKATATANNTSGYGVCKLHEMDEGEAEDREEDNTEDDDGGSHGSADPPQKTGEWVLTSLVAPKLDLHPDENDEDEDKKTTATRGAANGARRGGRPTKMQKQKHPRVALSARTGVTLESSATDVDVQHIGGPSKDEVTSLNPLTAFAWLDEQHASAVPSGGDGGEAKVQQQRQHEAREQALVRAAGEAVEYPAHVQQYHQSQWQQRVSGRPSSLPPNRLHTGPAATTVTMPPLAQGQQQQNQKRLASGHMKPMTPMQMRQIGMGMTGMLPPPPSRAHHPQQQHVLSRGSWPSEAACGDVFPGSFLAAMTPHRTFSPDEFELQLAAMSTMMQPPAPAEGVSLRADAAHQQSQPPAPGAHQHHHRQHPLLQHLHHQQHDRSRTKQEEEEACFHSEEDADAVAREHAELIDWSNQVIQNITDDSPEQPRAGATGPVSKATKATLPAAPNAAGAGWEFGWMNQMTMQPIGGGGENSAAAPTAEHHQHLASFANDERYHQNQHLLYESRGQHHHSHHNRHHQVTVPQLRPGRAHHTARGVPGSSRSGGPSPYGGAQGLESMLTSSSTPPAPGAVHAPPHPLSSSALDEIMNDLTEMEQHIQAYTHHSSSTELGEELLSTMMAAAGPPADSLSRQELARADRLREQQRFELSANVSETQAIQNLRQEMHQRQRLQNQRLHRMEEVQRYHREQLASDAWGEGSAYV